MLDIELNPALRVEKAEHNDPELSVYIVDDFLASPQALVDYARSKAYFGKVGADGTAYPGVRDRLPKPYERVLARLVQLVYGASEPLVHRCLLSLTTVQPEQLYEAQKIPHVDAFGDDQFAAVHYLCGPPHGGTAFYRYRPRNLLRIRKQDNHVVDEMKLRARELPEEHGGYIVGDTSLYRQELGVDARFNRVILYPSNLLHCAQLDSADSLVHDVARGRLTVSSFFQLDATAVARAQAE